MVQNFVSTFIATSIGGGVAFVSMALLKPERRQFGPMFIETVGLSLGMAVPELAFACFPILHDGWMNFATRLLVMWAIFLPACFLAERIIKRNAL